LYRYRNKWGGSSAAQEMIAKIKMYLRIENNNKFVRGKKKVKESIENYLKLHYKMKCTEYDEYIFFVPYKTIDGLKKEVYEIIRELCDKADMKNCFIETDVSCEELGIDW
jgi:L-lactate utilization protein LutC